MRKVYLFLVSVALVSFVSCKKEDNAVEKIKAENVEMASDKKENTAEKVSESDQAVQNYPVMSFAKTEHDFGTIKKGTNVEEVFEFTNTGNAPLIITNATSSCGCTVPEYPKNTAIAPGETSSLLVKFNGSGQNQVTKTVTVTANTEKGTENLTIKAFVEADASNPSISTPTTN